ncbi:hypothetical protein CXB51_004095 [Gossypium anomalum]|uniref:Reverse transcriptase Ty1/copia-type domain-containing protein n=1 Tax=Gossypium anomalum TaxID=47600 RepID=A0A8J5Z851_9ROSI|nr:hypothetical protein CXB51_004095 [Gossypium anomalum]
MDTEALHPSDTPRHSSNDASQGQTSTPLSNVQYFSKHDTVKLGEQNYLLWKHQILLILEGYELEGYVLGTFSIPSPFISGHDGQPVNNPAFLLYKKQDKFLASWLLSTSISEQEQVSIILAGLSMEYESIRIFASATQVSLDLLTEMLFDCEARQLALLTEIPLQANLVSHHKQATDGKSGTTANYQQEYKPAHRGHGRGWTCYHRFDETFSGVSTTQQMSVNCHQVQNQDGSSTRPCSHACNSYWQPPLQSSGSDQVWYPDSGATNHITPDITSLANAAPYTGSTSMLAGSKLLRLQNVLHIPTVCKNLLSVGQFARDNELVLSPHPPATDSQFNSQFLGTAHLSSSPTLWHKRLGHHPVHRFLRRFCVTPGSTFSSQKPKCFSVFYSFNQMVHVQFGGSIKMLQSDWGGELPTPILQQRSPYEVLYKVKPSYSHFKVFGCACYPCLRPYHPNKLQFRSSLCIFLGIGHNQKGYRCLDRDGRMFVSRHVTFDEDYFPFQHEFSSEKTARGVHHQSALPVVVKGSSMEHDTLAHEAGPGRSPFAVESSVQQSDSQLSPPAPLASWQIQAVVNTHPMQTRSKSGIFKPKLFTSALSDHEPTSIGEALQSPAWTAAAQAEYTTLLANHTGTLCLYLLEEKQWVASGFLESNAMLMGLSLGTKEDWWSRDTSKKLGLNNKGQGSTIGVSIEESTLWPQTSPSDVLMYVLIYVDDIIITGNNNQAIDQFVRQLDATFSLKDLGRLSYFLGIEVHYTTTGLFLNQRKYILDLLRRASMEGSKATPTPMTTTCQLSVNEGQPVADAHFTKSSKFLLEGFSDASWGSDIDDRRSTSGYCVFLGGIQFPGALGNSRWSLGQLPRLNTEVSPMLLLKCSAAVAVAGNPVMHSKFKHVELDLFFVREKVAQGIFQVGHVPSQEQVADMLTKPLAARLFSKFRNQLRVTVSQADVVE